MNIQPISNYNISMGRSPKKPDSRNIVNRIKQFILDSAPEITIKDNKSRMDKWRKTNEKISKPAENRVIMGATAIILQPLIDYSNKRVDDETRRVSICRTIAKIIAGTLVGIIVRGSSYKLVEKMTDIKGVGKYSKSLLPEQKYMKYLSKGSDFLKNYRSALSTGLAVLAMCITNFSCDAPLTVYLTNMCAEKTSNTNKVAQKQESKEVAYG